jgi:hypothetical protein
VTVLCAVDLDRTLIFSRAAAADGGGDPLVAVERRAGVDVSWMTARAAGDLARLAGFALVAPVTTRTPRQCAGLLLPGPPPRYLVAANGGVLLVDGVPDAVWAARTRNALSAVAPLTEIWAQVSRLCRPEWTEALRNADGLFCYTVLQRERVPAGMVAEAAEWAASRGWRVSLQGRKLYWVPKPLRKSAGVQEIVRREGSSALLAAGDSLLDADVLAEADAGIAARHGELVASGWTAPRVAVTRTAGVRAGEEIVRWLLQRASLSVRRDGGAPRTARPAADPPEAAPLVSRSPDPRAPAG